MNFISISGVAGSGKSTISTQIFKHFHDAGFTINEFAFAGPLKDALCLWFGWDRQRLDTDFAYKEGDTLDDGSPDPYCQRLGMTRRVIMQKFGTECMRDGMHSDFWIILADLALKLGKIPQCDIYIASDSRYTNELKWMESLNGYMIKVGRADNSSLTDKTNHTSEKQFLSWNNYTKEIINIIDPCLSEYDNMKKFISVIDETITDIHKHFNLPTRKI